MQLNLQDKHIITWNVNTLFPYPTLDILSFFLYKALSHNYRLIQSAVLYYNKKTQNAKHTIIQLTWLDNSYWQIMFLSRYLNIGKESAQL